MNSKTSMLEVLRRVIQEVNGARNLDAALSTMVRRIRKAMQTDVCSFYLYDKELESLVLMETIGLRTQAVGRVVLPLGEGLVGLVAKRSEPLNLEDAQSHSHFRYFEATGEERYCSFLGVPIIHQRHMLGVLVVQQAEKRRYDDEDEAFLVTMAAQLAGVLAHALATGHLTRPALPGGQAMFKGVAASPGMAMGEAVVITPPADLNSVPDLIPSDQEYEIARLKEAIGKTRDEIRAAAERLVNRISSQELALFDVYQQMLGEAALSEEVEKRIREGQWAPGALADVVRRHVQYLERVDDDYLRERAADIRDLGRRVLAHLQEDTPATPETYPDNAILVGDEISVAMLGEVPRDKLKGLVSVRGSSTSHVAIVARAMGIPTVLGMMDLPLPRLNGAPVVLDGHRGRLFVRPMAELKARYASLIAEESAQRRTGPRAGPAQRNARRSRHPADGEHRPGGGCVGHAEKPDWWGRALSHRSTVHDHRALSRRKRADAHVPRAVGRLCAAAGGHADAGYRRRQGFALLPHRRGQPLFGLARHARHPRPS